jgi:hypothetical protein
VAALAGLVAHGGVAGAIVESLVLLTVVGVFIAIWLRERRVARERAATGPARLRDDDEAPPQ